MSGNNLFVLQNLNNLSELQNRLITVSKQLDNRSETVGNGGQTVEQQLSNYFMVIIRIADQCLKFWTTMGKAFDGILHRTSKHYKSFRRLVPGRFLQQASDHIWTIQQKVQFKFFKTLTLTWPGVDKLSKNNGLVIGILKLACQFVTVSHFELQILKIFMNDPIFQEQSGFPQVWDTGAFHFPYDLSAGQHWWPDTFTSMWLTVSFEEPHMHLQSEASVCSFLK